MAEPLKKVSSVLYELIPLRLSDMRRLLRWAADNQYSLLRLLANLLVLFMRVVIRISGRTWGKIAVFALGLGVFHRCVCGSVRVCVQMDVNGCLCVHVHVRMYWMQGVCAYDSVF